MRDSESRLSQPRWSNDHWRKISKRVQMDFGKGNLIVQVSRVKVIIRMTWYKRSINNNGLNNVRILKNKI